MGVALNCLSDYLHTMCSYSNRVLHWCTAQYIIKQLQSVNYIIILASYVVANTLHITVINGYSPFVDIYLIKIRIGLNYTIIVFLLMLTNLIILSYTVGMYIASYIYKEPVMYIALL